MGNKSANAPAPYDKKRCVRQFQSTQTTSGPIECRNKVVLVEGFGFRKTTSTREASVCYHFGCRPRKNYLQTDCLGYTYVSFSWYHSGTATYQVAEPLREWRPVLGISKYLEKE